MSLRRWLWLCLAVGVVDAADALPPIRPLAMSGTALEVVDHALIRLAQGDTSAVEALPLESFLDPVARPDPLHAGVGRRWTMALPAALARLEPSARGHALTRLDARYRVLAGTRSGVERARLASAFLPAASASADLARERDRAFDLGRFGDFLGLAHLLAAGGEAGDTRRDQVALQLSGLGPQVDAALHLPPPGTPLPSAAAAQTAPGTLAMRWRVVPGWVLACDPFDEVVWQYRVDRLAEVTTGPGAVLVRDSAGLRALDEAGTPTSLRPLPAGAAVLAIGGGSAWFATGERAWRLGLEDGVIQALDLDAPPLGPPLVRGPQSLWLTARELLLFDHDQLTHRFLHGLPATSGWRLGADGERPVVRAGDGRGWRLESFNDQLARRAGAERAELLLRARRPQEALAALGTADAPRERQLAVRAHLALGVAHVVAQREAVQALCGSAQDQALVLLAVLAAGASDPTSTLHRLASAPDARGAEVAALDTLAAAEPALLLTDEAGALGMEPATWDHQCSGAAWTRWRSDAPAAPPRVPAAEPLVEALPVPLSAPAQARLPAPVLRQGDGGLTQGPRTWRLERGLDALTVTCRGGDGTMLWRQRWRPSSYLSAPSQTLDVRDGQVQVLEGGSRLSVFDAALGVRLAVFTADDLGSGTSFVLGGDILAVLGPLGLDRTLTLTGAAGLSTSIPLPSPARWAVPIAGQLLVRGADGVARLYPQCRVAALPEALAQSRQAPLVTAEGLVLGDRLWRWAR